MKRLIWLLRRIFVTVLLVIIGVAAVKTLRLTSKQVATAPLAPISINETAIQRFSQAIKIPTFSKEGQMDSLTFKQIANLFKHNYPLVDSLLESVPAPPLSLIYKWPGRNPELSPVLLIGHTDIVTISEKTKDDWQFPPLSGAVEDGFILGRGTLDDKIAVVAALESAEMLLKEGFTPNRTIYFAFGHDEEIGGGNGAKVMAEWFERDGLNFEYVLDEGMIVLEDGLPGINKPIGLIGIAEKGYASFQIEVKLEEGGHSSMPPKETAISILSTAILKLNENPFPAKIDGVVEQLFDYAAPEMDVPFKILFANRWLTNGILLRQLSNSPASNAMVRTTVAPTMIEGGFQENVLPSQVSATVNLRILPGETTETAQAYLEKVIDDKRVNIKTVGGFNKDPSFVSPTNSFGFQTIQKTILEVFPDVVVAPSLVVAGTDSRHYKNVSKNIYRFLPVRLEKSDLGRIHGINERISIENYYQAIRFYKQLMVNSTK